jgi:hypothetical protein
VRAWRLWVYPQLFESAIASANFALGCHTACDSGDDSQPLC